MTTLINHLYRAVDATKPIITIFLDLQKAFDMVDYKLLLTKLHSYGIRGIALHLIKTYLCNRKLMVSIPNGNSNFEIVKAGVLQSTILGPILFLVYINNLLELKLDANKTPYADDTDIIIKEESWPQLKDKIANTIHYVSKWLEANLLSVSANKTVYMPVGSYIGSAPKQFG